MAPPWLKLRDKLGITAVLLLTSFPIYGAAQSDCVDVSPQTILGYNPECRVDTGENCVKKTKQFDASFSTEYSHVMCKLTHMCLMLDEDTIMNEYNLAHDRMVDLTLADPGCRAQHVAKSVALDDADHLLFCSRKACQEDAGLSAIQQAHASETGESENHEHFNCGTDSSKSNRTHLIYKNYIYSPGSTKQVGENTFIQLAGDGLFKLPFTCSWERTFFRTAKMGWSRDAVVQKIFIFTNETGGQGRFTVELRLYTDSSFTATHSSAPIIRPGERLYLGADVLHTGFEETTLYPTIVHLWTTAKGSPLPDKDSMALVVNGCPVHNQTVVVNNGDDDVAKMATPPVFQTKCPRNPDGTKNCRVYVHAYVLLCSPYVQGACTVDCSETNLNILGRTGKRKVQPNAPDPVELGRTQGFDGMSQDDFQNLIQDFLDARDFQGARSRRSVDKKIYTGSILTLGPMLLDDGESYQSSDTTITVTEDAGVGPEALVLLLLAVLTVIVLLVVFIVVYKTKYRLMEVNS